MKCLYTHEQWMLYDRLLYSATKKLQVDNIIDKVKWRQPKYSLGRDFVF